MGDDLGGRGGNHSGQAESVHSPVQVGRPALTLQGEALTQGRLIHLWSEEGSFSDESLK